MNLDLTKLLIHQINSINIEDIVNIPKELMASSLIYDLNDVKISAHVGINEEDDIILEGSLSGIMLLKDDITLEPVEYKFNTTIEEILPKQNIVDITELIWQNILVEIPSKVRATNEDVYLSGDGWRVISEEQYNKERNKANNPFDNLDELLKIKEEK